MWEFIYFRLINCWIEYLDLFLLLFVIWKQSMIFEVVMAVSIKIVVICNNAVLFVWTAAWSRILENITCNKIGSILIT